MGYDSSRSRLNYALKRRNPKTKLLSQLKQNPQRFPNKTPEERGLPFIDLCLQTYLPLFQPGSNMTSSAGYINKRKKSTQEFN